jgi:hypothetical protein
MNNPLGIRAAINSLEPEEDVKVFLFRILDAVEKNENTNSSALSELLNELAEREPGGGES